MLAGLFHCFSQKIVHTNLFCEKRGYPFLLQFYFYGGNCMKAIKKFLALLLTAVMAFTVVPVFAAQSSSVPEKALSAGRLYGYRVFDDDDTMSYAWISFTADNPAVVTEEQVEENAFDDYTNMNCGAYVNGYVYGFAENGYFYRVNTADWSRERLFADASSYNGWSDMTFDYTTGRLYAVAYNLPWDSGDDETAIEASFLVTIDLLTYEITQVAQITTGILTLAADAQGELYGIAMDGCLYHINKQDGSTRNIGSTGQVVSYAQSMCYDYNTGTMYWALCNISQGVLCSVNLETGAASRLGIIGGNTEVVSLFAVPESEPVVHVESIDIEPAEASIDVGLTLQLSASVSPENATEKRVSWSTSDAGIATVNENGVVYGSTAGTAVITAASLDGGIIGTCTVTVNAAASSSDYQRVDTLESGGDYLIVTRVGGQAYALVNRNASPNNFAAMLVPVVLSADGEYVLSPLDSSESMDDLLWAANGDYTNGFSFRSVGSGLYFAGLTYCNWTAINQTEDLWLPLEHTDGGTAKTILKSVRAEQIDPTAVKLYAGITTGYFDSVIFDYVRIADAANVEFYKFGSSGSEYALGDVNMDGSVSVSDALMVLRFTMGLETLSDAQLELADFNGDGTVSTVDALDILRAAI